MGAGCTEHCKIRPRFSVSRLQQDFSITTLVELKTSCDKCGGLVFDAPPDPHRGDMLRCRKCGGLGVSELRRLRQLEEENHKLKQLVADLSLDKAMLQDVIQKKL